MKRFIGHTCPGSRLEAELRSVTRPSGRETRRSFSSVGGHPGEEVRRQELREEILSRTIDGFGCQPRWFLRQGWFATLAAPR